MRKTAASLILILAVSFFISQPCWSQEQEAETPLQSESTQESKPKCLEAVEFLSGFGWGKLRGKEDYRLIPFIVGFDFNLKNLTQKFNFNPPQLIQFQIEPFVSSVLQPEANAEIGSSFALKVGILPQTAKIQPYIKVSLGMVYMSQHTKEQSTQFNFIEYGGLGVHYFFRKNTAFTLEGRYRHLSNCSIDHPNTGINTAFVVAGIAYQF
ncbi:MAG: acyloxyacyl hydrolase [Candidatus Omnitrophica bacterium]|nr:acyloxyacyl hydrolase [Candidatus Omnitrophota bacterium]